ncbi:hypothetical protein O5D80_001318 [Batrachochytrium dendrobatidis]|nr:hypothetical protein O5D80_001318 [Batrachochytrium dendrobatidis]
MHRSMSNICVSATKLQSMTHPHDPTCQIMYCESKIDQKPDHGKHSMLLHIRVDISSDSCTLADDAQRISHNTCTVLHCSHWMITGCNVIPIDIHQHGVM